MAKYKAQIGNTQNEHRVPNSAKLQGNPQKQWYEKNQRGM